uniref:Neur_chan_LBD domain-containing protein n=1 Tax=Syphacia muris TaxID=451379 RepID=A0A0N5AK20_9BILA
MPSDCNKLITSYRYTVIEVCRYNNKTSGLISSTTGRITVNNYFRDLLSNYNPLVRPVKNSSTPLTVSMKVFLQQIIGIVWKDYQLSWNPEKYEHLSSVRFAGDGTIWQPDVLMYNSADEDFDSTFKSNLVVYSDGTVNWIPPGIFKASCKIDITWFPFDDQSCYLKFGSWTFHGYDLDLQIHYDEDFNASDASVHPTMDLSSYIPSGEWVLKDAPVFRDVRHYSCCQEPYPTLRFFMNLRRRTLYYGFNLIIPSLVISLMTLLAFSLPAHDMSEKIGFQTTILLSVCFFLTIVSEMTPATSEAIPLLGIFFSTLTMVVAVSTTFTITVLNLRYRQADNHQMSKTLRKVFLVWLPWILMMKRPGYKHLRSRTIRVNVDRVNSEECVQCVGIDAVEADVSSKIRHENSARKLTMMSELQKNDSVLHRIPTEQLGLERKIGDGIFTSRRCVNVRLRKLAQHQKYVEKCVQLFNDPKSEVYDPEAATIANYYFLIYSKLKIINNILDNRKEKQDLEEDWRFAAMVLDRLCLYIFTTFLTACLCAIFISPPYLNA